MDSKPPELLGGRRGWSALGLPWPTPLADSAAAPTFKASGRLCSGRLATLSVWMVSVKAGHGDEWAYLERLEKSS